MSAHLEPTQSRNPGAKVVIAGAASVGKSSIVRRLVQDKFFHDSVTTAGAEFYAYTCPVDGEMFRLQIWDTAGQELFRAISKSYFRNAAGAVLVFDITSVSSFDMLSVWLNDLQTLCLPNAYILLVGNKCDLENDREVGTQLINDFCQRYSLTFIETSALNGHGIKEAFAQLALEVHHRIKAKSVTQVAVASLDIVGGSTGDKKKCC